MCFLKEGTIMLFTGKKGVKYTVVFNKSTADKIRSWKNKFEKYFINM